MRSISHLPLVRACGRVKFHYNYCDAQNHRTYLCDDLDKSVIVYARRWNYSEFSTCMSPCGIGIQTRDVTCIHEVTQGTGKAVPVPNSMCPQPPPADRRYCNVWDCPVKWSTGEWGKVLVYIFVYKDLTIVERALDA